MLPSTNDSIVAVAKRTIDVLQIANNLLCDSQVDVNYKVIKCPVGYQAVDMILGPPPEPKVFKLFGLVSIVVCSG